MNQVKNSIGPSGKATEYFGGYYYHRSFPWSDLHHGTTNSWISTKYQCNLGRIFFYGTKTIGCLLIASGSFITCVSLEQGWLNPIPVLLPSAILKQLHFWGEAWVKRQVIFDLHQFSDPDRCTAQPHEAIWWHRQPEDVNKNQASRWG